MVRPFSPYPYVPLSYQNMVDDLSSMLEAHIKRYDIKASDLIHLYGSVRENHIYKIRTGRGSELGLKMMFSIAEACGLKAKLQVLS